MFALRDIAVTLIAFGSLPFIMVRPQIGILMWDWFAYMVPHRLGWSFARDFQFAQIIAVATILAWLLSKEPKKLPMDILTALLIVLLFWISLTTIFAILPDLAYSDWDRSMKIIVMTFFTIMLMQTRGWIEAQVWVIVCSIGFYGVKGGVFIFLGGGGRVYGPGGGFFSENNALGLALTMIVPLMWYLQTRVDNFFGKWALRGSMAVTMLAIVGTHSRGAALAAAAMVLFLLIKSRKRALLVFGVVVGMIVVIPFIPERWYDRVETIKSFEQDSSAMGRIHAWTFAVKLALDNPILGGGYGVNADRQLFMSYVPEAEKVRTFHSSYFQMLGEHGFVGLAIFLMLGISTFLTGSAIIRQTKNRPELHWANDLARMLQVSLVGYAVGGAFLDMAIFDFYFHVIALMLLTKLVIAKEIKAAAPAPAVTDNAFARATGWNDNRQAEQSPRSAHYESTEEDDLTGRARPNHFLSISRRTGPRGSGST